MEHDYKLYFVALLPPKEIQEEVTEIKFLFKSLYQAGHALKSPPHITLIPPFSWDEMNEDFLLKIMEECGNRENQFTLELDGFSSFPPRVIYIAVKENAQLHGLFRNLSGIFEEKLKISEKIKGLDRFSPHMSVAFRDLTKQNFKKAWKEYKNKSFNYTFPVSQISLLKHNGKYWDVIYNALLNVMKV